MLIVISPHDKVTGAWITSGDSTNSLAYAGVASTNDLINAGQATLASTDVTPSHWAFPGGGINDGLYDDGIFKANTFFTFGEPDVHFPAAATYQLNLAGAPHGYDLTSMDSFMGWYSHTPQAANQTYTVEVSTVRRFPASGPCELCAILHHRPLQP